MAFRISALDAAQFQEFTQMTDQELVSHGARRMQVTEKPGFPCRVTLEDAEVGESVLLLNYEHLPVDSPYRSAHAIFVREGAPTRSPIVDAIPEQLLIRLLSIRAFGADGMMLDAEVVDGRECAPVIEQLLANPAVAYLHIHNARPGCYAARVDRS